MTDEQIIEVLQKMPGGKAGFRDRWGYVTFGRAVEAAARAEVEPLVLELLGAAQMANHGSDCATLHGGERCDCWKHQLTKKVQAWGRPQVGDKGDGNAHP